jgi:peptidoglycan/xylan/chitin deacetylase (PgdA/CDA1 family)
MRRFPSRRAAVLLVLAGLLAFVPGQQAGQSASAATKTVVSLTFDDGHLSHYSTLKMLDSHGMHGTYYINSAMVGTSWYYMIWPEIHDLADAGNEIGGHTLHHANLAQALPSGVRKEVCDDRQNLLDRGFAPVASFAYPEAALNAAAEKVVQQCGYKSARSVGNVYSDGECKGCPYAETVPPADPFELKTPEPTDVGTTLSKLKSYVTDVETHGGGWVILNFHGICNYRCTGESSLSKATFAAFLDWLEPRSANGTVVRTVGQVMGVPVPQPKTTPSPPVKSHSGMCSGDWRGF